MYCPKCKTENSEQYNFCSNCGLKLTENNLQPPIVREPSDPPIIHNPYKASCTLGVIGSIISLFLFYKALQSGKYLESFNLFDSNTISMFFFMVCGAAGIAGTLLLLKEKLIGIILYLLSMLLPTVLYFIYLPAGYASLLFTPLMFAACITALIRKKNLDKYYSRSMK